MRLRRRRLPLAQERRADAPSARCCSASTTTRARSSTSACAASFTDAKRRELVEFLAPYRENALADHPWKDWAGAASRTPTAQRMPGAKSRWSQGKDLSWEPLRPELVVEVAYDHMQGDRFRHTAQFRRWRTDKKPRDCTYAQLEVVAAARARGDLRDRPLSAQAVCRRSRGFARRSRHSRVGSSSGSGVSCGGR